MSSKIDNEINEFTKNIKEKKSCDELLFYMNSSYSSSIKLLMSISNTFSLYVRLLLFFTIAFSAMSIFSIINADKINIAITLMITLFLYFVLLSFIISSKKSLALSINDIKNLLKQ